MRCAVFARHHEVHRSDTRDWALGGYAGRQRAITLAGMPQRGSDLKGTTARAISELLCAIGAGMAKVDRAVADEYFRQQQQTDTCTAYSQLGRKPQAWSA